MIAADIGVRLYCVTIGSTYADGIHVHTHLQVLSSHTFQALLSYLSAFVQVVVKAEDGVITVDQDIRNNMIARTPVLFAATAALFGKLLSIQPWQLQPLTPSSCTLVKANLKRAVAMLPPCFYFLGLTSSNDESPGSFCLVPYPPQSASDSAFITEVRTTAMEVVGNVLQFGVAWMKYLTSKEVPAVGTRFGLLSGAVNQSGARGHDDVPIGGNDSHVVNEELLTQWICAVGNLRNAIGQHEEPAAAVGTTLDELLHPSCSTPKNIQEQLIEFFQYTKQKQGKAALRDLPAKAPSAAQPPAAPPPETHSVPSAAAGVAAGDGSMTQPTTTKQHQSKQQQQPTVKTVQDKAGAQSKSKPIVPKPVVIDLTLDDEGDEDGAGGDVKQEDQQEAVTHVTQARVPHHPGVSPTKQTTIMDAFSQAASSRGREPAAQHAGRAAGSSDVAPGRGIPLASQLESQAMDDMPLRKRHHLLLGRQKVDISSGNTTGPFSKFAADTKKDTDGDTSHRADGHVPKAGECAKQQLTIRASFYIYVPRRGGWCSLIFPTFLSCAFIHC